MLTEERATQTGRRIYTADAGRQHLQQFTASRDAARRAGPSAAAETCSAKSVAVLRTRMSTREVATQTGPGWTESQPTTAWRSSLICHRCRGRGSAAARRPGRGAVDD